jgi:hypothetical protein
MLSVGSSADRQARREWSRRQLECQKTSNLTIAEFCRQRGINRSTFCSWQRRVRDAASDIKSQKNQAKPAAASMLIVDAPFVPVSIVDSSSTGQLEIALGNSCTVRLTGAVDPNLLRVAIRAAGRLPGNRQGAQ